MLINVFLVTGIVCCLCLLTFISVCEFVSFDDYIIYFFLLLAIFLYFMFLFIFNRS